jgi:hypothetical protein
MFPEQLKKILKLIKQTGDRVIVFDPSAPDDSYVILDLDRYSGMVNSNLTEVVKKVELKEEKIVVNKPEELAPDLAQDSVKTENLTEDDLTDKINREISMWKNREEIVELTEENKPKKAWQIPSQVKNNAQIVE